MNEREERVIVDFVAGLERKKIEKKSIGDCNLCLN